MNLNPFTPSPGASPPVLAGRDDILYDVEVALDSGPAHPDYTMFLVGDRAMGKTAVLRVLEKRAGQRSWMIIAADASTPGLPDRIEADAVTLLRERRGGFRRTGGRLSRKPGRVQRFGLQPPRPPRGLRNVLTVLGDTLGERGLGVLITIDEMQNGERHELRRFAAVLQQVTRREGRPIAFVGAALPRLEDTLLSDDAVAFLQRAARRTIDRLDEAATGTAIAQPIRDRNAHIDPRGLEVATRATSGHPLMIQLVGYHSWEAAADPMTRITLADVTAGVARARRRWPDPVPQPV